MIGIEVELFWRMEESMEEVSIWEDSGEEE
jgi:hypothetical protein